jgi:peptide/nickel transport system substrate-binding protein
MSSPLFHQEARHYVEAQKILAADLPAINLWYRDTVIVHNKRLTEIAPTPSGSYPFLEMPKKDVFWR